MSPKRRSQGSTVLLLTLLLLLLVPLSGLQSQSAGPTPEQLTHYHQGRSAWNAALRATRPTDKMASAACAEGHLSDALKGGEFPEAHLALGLLYFNRSGKGERYDPDAYRAERHLKHAGEHGSGAVRAEAQTYLGVLALHCRHWAMARQTFDAANGANIAATRLSAPGPTREFQARAERLAAVRRVGSSIAAYYQAVDPADPAPSDASYRTALQTLEGMSGGLDGTGAALWRFPEREHPRPRQLSVPVFPSARADWTLGGGATPPSGVEPVSVERFAEAGRIWASGRLGVDPPQVAVAGLGTQDRRNLMMGLVKSLYRMEGQRNFTGAAAILDRLAGITEAGTFVRQHRIWIALEGNPNLDEATRLVGGPGAQNDPLYGSELFRLADRLAAAGRVPQAQTLLERLAGMNGAGVAPYRALAKWNLAAMLVSTRTPSSDPAVWQRGLALLDVQQETVPAARYRQELRLMMQLRLAEALVAGRQAPRVETVLQAAATTEQGIRGRMPGMPAGSAVQAFSEYLAKRVFETGQQDQYMNGFLRRTQYAPLYVASRAATGNSAEALRLLQQAAGLAGTNTPLAARLRADIQALQSGGPDSPATRARREFVQRWNQAVATTRSARGVGAGDAAGFRRAWSDTATAWDGLVAAQGGTPDELTMARDYAARSRQATPGSRTSSTNVADASAYPAALQAAVAGPYRGRPIPAGDRMSILRATAPVTPNRDMWLEKLGRDPEALQLMVHWFNRGSSVTLAGNRVGNGLRAKRFDSGADLLAFLRENTLPEAHVLPIGTTQWTVAPQSRRATNPKWLGSRLGYKTAAYCLTNGIPLVNVRCSNPVSPILESVQQSTTPATMGPDARELPAPGADPVQLSYATPQPGWTWPDFQRMSGVMGTAGGPAFPICAPAVTLVATAPVPPQFPLPPGVTQMPHCSPSRFTLGRISTRGAARFGPHEDVGTAESRRR